MFPNVSLFSAISLLTVSYLIGSIPSTVIASRLAANVDLRQFGSGSAGGTNAIRVLGPVWGLIAGIADVAKGSICAGVVAVAWFQSGVDIVVWKVAAGGAAVVGHIWPIWAGFKGGKGVASGVGVMAAVDLPAAIAFAFLGIASAAVSRYVSVGSMVAAGSLPVVLILQSAVLDRHIHPAVTTFAVAFALLVLYTHRSNLRRLASGTELRLDRTFPAATDGPEPEIVKATDQQTEAT